MYIYNVHVHPHVRCTCVFSIDCLGIEVKTGTNSVHRTVPVLGLHQVNQGNDKSIHGVAWRPRPSFIHKLETA